jgi:hypothetical protein
MISGWLSDTQAQADHRHHHQPPGAPAGTQVVVPRVALDVLENGVNLSANTCEEGASNSALRNFDRSQLQDDPGFHGMVMFGNDPFYIYHLPMWMPQHAYQAIFEVRLSDDVKAQYLAASRAGKHFSFAPEDEFVLPQMALTPGPIQGTIHNDHFERGGEPLTDAKLEIVRTVYFKQLKEDEPKPAKDSYVVFGNGKEKFMAREAHGRPDFDEIIPVPSTLQLPEAVTNEISGNGQSYVDVQRTSSELSIERGDARLNVPNSPTYHWTGDLE